jgi:hypothetical protein
LFTSRRSYGVVIWELIMRQQPYSDIGDNAITIGFRITRGSRPFLPTNFPAAIGALLQSCWLREINARPTADQLVSFWSNPNVVPPELRGQIL